MITTTFLFIYELNYILKFNTIEDKPSRLFFLAYGVI